MADNAEDAKVLQNIKDTLSDQAGEIEIPTFWQMKLTPNSNGENTFPVNFPNCTYLTLTNICLPEITDPSNNQPVNEPVRVFAHVKGYNEEDSTVLIATLIPGKNEHQVLNILFSPIDEVTLELKGKLSVDIVGFISLFEDSEYELGEEEEEEEEEEAKEDEEEKKE